MELKDCIGKVVYNVGDPTKEPIKILHTTFPHFLYKDGEGRQCTGSLKFILDEWELHGVEVKQARYCTATEIRIRSIIGMRIDPVYITKISDILNERQAEVTELLAERDATIRALEKKIVAIKEIL